MLINLSLFYDWAPCELFIYELQDNYANFCNSHTDATLAYFTQTQLKGWSTYAIYIKPRRMRAECLSSKSQRFEMFLSDAWYTIFSSFEM